MSLRKFPVIENGGVIFNWDVQYVQCVQLYTLECSLVQCGGCSSLKAVSVCSQPH